MIGVCLDGRLGNQLFQYAFAMALAKKKGVIYFIDNDNKVDHVKKYFKVNAFANNKITRILFKKRIGSNISDLRLSGTASPGEILNEAANNQYYRGYFQSELFFNNIRHSIRNRFRIRENYINAFNKKYSRLFTKKIIAIHYRLSDYLTWGDDKTGGVNMTLPESYFMNALRQIENLDDYQIILVTDDKQNIKSKLPDIKNKQVISDEEIMDFQILLNADIVISSNSSFSWWAGYLNKKNAPVYAPENWLGFKINKEHPQNIIPSTFIKIPVISLA